MARMKIESLSESRCTIQFTDEFDQPHNLELFAPAAGGYVKIEARGYPQICERLSSTGNTLMWSPASGPLSELVRREYRKRRAAERRDLRRD